MSVKSNVPNRQNPLPLALFALLALVGVVALALSGRLALPGTAPAIEPGVVAPVDVAPVDVAPVDAAPIVEPDVVEPVVVQPEVVAPEDVLSPPDMSVDPLARDLTAALAALGSQGGNGEALLGMMAPEFGYGFWRSEWQTLTPETALPAIQPIFSASPAMATTHLENAPNALLDGINPFEMLGPERDVTTVLLIQGLGVDHAGEALLYITTTAGQQAWHAMLYAPEGFAPAPSSDITAVAGLILAHYGGGLLRLTADGTIQPLTDVPATLSPGGTYAVYPDFENNPEQLVVIDTASGQVERVTVHTRLVGCYGWLDETHVLCGIRMPDEEDGPNLGHLARINVKSGDFLSFMDTYLFSQPAVSPDRQTVAFDGGEQRAFLWQAHSDNLVEFDYTQFEGAPYIENGRIGSPSYAGDGRQLAWLVGNGAATDVVIFDLEAQTARSVFTFEPAGFGGWFPAVVWSPDDRWLAVQALTSGEETNGLYLVAADGGSVQHLGGRELTNPVWLSPTQLVVTRGDVNGMKLSQVELYDLVSGEFQMLNLPEGTYSVGLVP